MPLNVDETTRQSYKICGGDIGTFTGWDQVDTIEFIFYNFIPNELGLKFLRRKELTGEWNLNISFESGEVYLSSNDDPEEKRPEGDIVIPNLDWSVLNKEA